jgi:hypothetical protein
VRIETLMQLDMSAKSNGAKRKKTRTSACTDVAPYNLYTRFIRWPLPVRKRRVARAFLGAVERNRRGTADPAISGKNSKSDRTSFILRPGSGASPPRQPGPCCRRMRSTCPGQEPTASFQVHFAKPSISTADSAHATPRPMRCHQQSPSLRVFREGRHGPSHRVSGRGLSVDWLNPMAACGHVTRPLARRDAACHAVNVVNMT